MAEYTFTPTSQKAMNGWDILRDSRVVAYIYGDGTEMANGIAVEMSGLIERGHAAIRLLREHQWVLIVLAEQPESDGHPPGIVTAQVCIAGCGNTKVQGHAEDCELAKIIKEGIVESETEEEA